jgi:hypothetical protein
VAEVDQRREIAVAVGYLGCCDRIAYDRDLETLL